MHTIADVCIDKSFDLARRQEDNGTRNMDVPTSGTTKNNNNNGAHVFSCFGLKDTCFSRLQAVRAEANVTSFYAHAHMILTTASDSWCA